MPPAADLTMKDGVRIYSPAAALINVPEAFFRRFPVEAQVALTSARDASEVLGRLIEGGRSAVASRPAHSAAPAATGSPTRSSRR